MAKGDLGLWDAKNETYWVYSKVSWEKGEKIFEFEGDILPSYLIDPTRSWSLDNHFSIQWPVRHFQSHIGHSCEPNCYIDFSNGIPTLTARRHIFAGEGVRYNYNTVELELKTRKPFNCTCGADRCVDNIRGFMYLTPKQERDLEGQLSPFVKEAQAEFESSREPYY